MATPAPVPEEEEAASKKMGYTYTKLRSEFGRQERFLLDHFRVHANVKPLQKYRNLVLKKTIVDREVQATPQMSVDEMNTTRAEYVDVCIRHEEGGWPKDVNYNDAEMVQRHRKKLEKEESFLAAMSSMTEEMEELIKNNNTINLYRNAFTCQPVLKDLGKEGEPNPEGGKDGAQVKSTLPFCCRSMIKPPEPPPPEKPEKGGKAGDKGKEAAAQAQASQQKQSMVDELEGEEEGEEEEEEEGEGEEEMQETQETAFSGELPPEEETPVLPPPAVEQQQPEEAEEEEAEEEEEEEEGEEEEEEDA